jgi:hypothetical protein
LDTQATGSDALAEGFDEGPGGMAGTQSNPRIIRYQL